VSAPGPRTRTVRDLADLGPLADTWRALQCHPWSDLAYFTERLVPQEGFVRPHVIAVERGGATTGLVVGRLLAEEIPWRVGGRRVLRSRARVLRVGSSGVMGDPSPEAARAVVAEVRAALARGEADAAYFHQLPEDSALAVEVARVPGAAARDRFVRRVPWWTLELPATFEEFRASRSKSVRRALSRYMNKLLREVPALRLERYAGSGDMEVVMRDCTAVADLTYQRRIGVGFADDAATRDFVRWTLGAGWLRSHVLYDGDRPIAFWNHLTHARTLHTRETGYDPDYARLRPGVFVLAKIIEEACEDPRLERVDYGATETDVKREMGSHRSHLVSLYVFSGRPGGLVMAAKRAATGATDRFARSLLGSERARRWARRLKAPAGS